MNTRPHPMPLVEAGMSIDDTLEAMEADGLVNDLAEIAQATFDNPAIPMFARVAAMMTLVAGSANGALEMLDEGVAVSSFHRHDLVIHIAAMLHNSATIYQELAEALERESTPISQN